MRRELREGAGGAKELRGASEGVGGADGARVRRGLREGAGGAKELRGASEGAGGADGARVRREGAGGAEELRGASEGVGGAKELRTACSERWVWTGVNVAIKRIIKVITFQVTELIITTVHDGFIQIVLVIVLIAVFTVENHLLCCQSCPLSHSLASVVILFLSFYNNTIMNVL